MTKDKVNKFVGPAFIPLLDIPKLPDDFKGGIILTVEHDQLEKILVNSKAEKGRLDPKKTLFWNISISMA